MYGVPNNNYYVLHNLVVNDKKLRKRVHNKRCSLLPLMYCIFYLT